MRRRRSSGCGAARSARDAAEAVRGSRREARSGAILEESGCGRGRADNNVAGSVLDRPAPELRFSMRLFRSALVTRVLRIVALWLETSAAGREYFSRESRAAPE